MAILLASDRSRGILTPYRSTDDAGLLAVPAFSPDDVSGLQLWLNTPSLALSDNDLITSFTDYSGEGNHGVQASGGDQATYKTAVINGLAVARFANSQFYTTGVFDFPNWTIFAVLKRSGNIGSNGDSWFGAPSANGWAVYFLSNNLVALTKTAVNGINATSQAIANTDPHLIKLRYDGANVYFAVDGVSAGTVAYSSTFSNGAGYTIGSSEVTDTFSGDLGELVLYDEDIGTTAEDDVTEYLMDRWGL